MTGPSAATDKRNPLAAHVATSAIQTGEGYRTYLQTRVPIAVGQAQDVAVHLEPQSPFKSNDKYPYRFTVTQASGVATSSTNVTTASVSPEKTSLRFTVTGQTPGQGTVAGTFSFSVCTAEKCLVERAALVLSFEVVADALSASPSP